MPSGIGVTEEKTNENNSFQPALYLFYRLPLNGDSKKFALQPSFSVLFDNLITVLWSVYGNEPKIGIIQVEWALEFLKCMQVDYSYPESIRKIVGVLEKNLMDLYIKYGEKLNETLDESTEEIMPKNEEKSVINLESFNEKDIMGKLNTLHIAIDSTTGEVKHLKDLNSLGRRKPVVGDAKCKIENESSKTYMIGALQKILNKTAEEETKAEVEELIKGLKVRKSVSPECIKPTKTS